MRKVLGSCLALGVGVLLGRFWENALVDAQIDPPKKCAAENGDVNADGGVDVTDAIVLLGNQFLGEPSTLPALCKSTEVSQPGFTYCLDDSGRFADNGDGTVTDNCTGLMWQRLPPDFNDSGDLDADDWVPYASAQEYIENLALGGHDDWRLPTIIELQTTLDYDLSPPEVHATFESREASCYWSSSFFTPGKPMILAGSSAGWTEDDEGLCFIRAVRPILPAPLTSGLPATGQTVCYDEAGNEVDCASDTCAGQDGFYQTGCPGESRFVDNGDGTVTDNCTGLMWQKDTGNDGAGLGWCSALGYCENLELAGHDDWRLPKVRELHTLVDYGRESPSIDPVFGAMSFIYWSSTSVAVFPDLAWGVVFKNGNDGFDLKVNEFLVRAVRTAP